MTEWTVTVTAPAQRSLHRVPAKVIPAIIEFMRGPVADNPYRVGGHLGDELAGCLSARVGVYRILYDIDEEEHRVELFRIGHRSTVYRP